jgi:hypothetical protein
VKKAAVTTATQVNADLLIADWDFFGGLKDALHYTGGEGQRGVNSHAVGQDLEQSLLNPALSAPPLDGY